MALSDAEEKRIASIVAATLDQYRQQREPRTCALDIDQKEHAKEHAFIRDLMQVACKLEKIKWGFLGSLVKTVGGILIAALFIGIVFLVKQKSGGIVP